MTIHKDRTGYVALTSVIVVSIIALAITFTLSFTGFFVRSNISDSYFKDIANFLSESCARTAILKLANDPTYAGNENIAVDSDSCNIQAIQTSGQTKIIQTKGIYQKATANYKVTVNTADLSVISWEELATL